MINRCKGCVTESAANRNQRIGRQHGDPTEALVRGLAPAARIRAPRCRLNGHGPGCKRVGFVGVLVGCFLLLPIRAMAEQNSQPVSYRDHKLLTVEVSTEAQLEQLQSTGAIILDCIPRPAQLSVVASDAQLTAIDAFDLPIQVRHIDVQALIDQEKARGGQLRGDPFDDFFLDYHEYDNGEGSIVWYMNELATRHPSLVSLVNVGQTLQGNTIWGMKVTSNPTVEKPGVVYFSCEHAREWVTTTVPTFLATHLVQNYGIDSQITELVDSLEFYLIPVFNVDGYEYTWSTNRLWRKNRRDNGDGTFGVDLNRNWGEGWGGPGSDGTTSSEIYRGPVPFSEPETQELRDFFLAHPHIRAQLDIHSFSQLVLWPFGYTPDFATDQDIYQQIGLDMQALIQSVHGLAYQIGPIYTAIYPASGGSLDWTYVQRDILSYSFELRPSGPFPGFELPPEEIIPNNEEILPAILRLTDSRWVRDSLRFRYPDVLPPRRVPAGQSTAIEFTAIEQFGDVSPESVSLHYRLANGASFSEVSATPLIGNAYEAQLPATNCLSRVQYFISGETDLGGQTVDPAGAPSAFYEAAVFTDLIEHVSDDLEAPTGWTVGAFGDTASTGIWERADPEGTAAQPEEDHTPGAGTQCFVTGASGGSTGSDDVDGGSTTLLSPVYDLSTNSEPVVGYWRWFSNNAGSNPHTDQFVVEISDDGGLSWTPVERIGPSGPETTGGWIRKEFHVRDFVEPTAAMQLRFIASDTTPSSIVEAAIDDLEILDAVCEGIPGDYDGDGDIDTTDFTALPDCIAGPATTVPKTCAVFDMNDDNSVDLADTALILQQAQ